LRELDVNVAAEFIYMAAVLIHIKSKMLLPRDPDALAGAEDDPRTELVNRAIEVEVLRGLSQGVAELQFQGKVPVHQASVLKLYHTELAQRLAATGMKLIETHGLLFRGEKHAPLDGMIAQQYLYASTLTLQVGTSEIQRNIIATRGLGLPRG